MIFDQERDAWFFETIERKKKILRRGKKRGAFKEVKTDQFQFSHTSKTTLQKQTAKNVRSQQQQHEHEQQKQQQQNFGGRRRRRATLLRRRLPRRPEYVPVELIDANDAEQVSELYSSVNTASSFFRLPPLPRQTCTCPRRNRKRDLPLKTSWVNSSGTKRRSTMRLSRRFNFVLKRLSTSVCTRRKKLRRWREKKRWLLCVFGGAVCARSF